MNLLCLILGCICFTIGAFPKLSALAEINWQNLGLAFITLSLIV